MLLNPIHLNHFHQPTPPPHHVEEVDPFEALYNSLSNLTLTPTTLVPRAPAPVSKPAIPEPVPQPQPARVEKQEDEGRIPVNLIFPPGDNVIFAHSSYFARPKYGFPPDLPSVPQVRGQAILSHGSLPLPSPYFLPVPQAGLLVKYGADTAVTSTEAKTLLSLKRYLSDKVPVPEVFGWRRDVETGERVLYLSLPSDGVTLEQQWPYLSDSQKEHICLQIKDMVKSWRRLQQGGVEVVASIDNTPLKDEIFQFPVSPGLKIPAPGPFPNVSNFHSYFVATAVALSQNKQKDDDPAKINYQPHHLFPDNVPIVFTHGALHPRNIIVSMDGQNQPTVISVIGWEQAGWYPAYWELCKARHECSKASEQGTLLGDWESKYLPAILNLDGYGLGTQGWNGRALCQYWDYFVGLMHRWQ
ncbi:hypothetical protein B0T21DRAFT_381581 [Apiosordaria backusii]|uniref:Aminoglycoside phosphotransferase domain-containing protein n=1 Tax=Apiosordaria backusii TaxID=314023 RepID=A0AA40EM45_9PEZI|nr:hypothetical protein B0T21DRAFT_381581 [Apiosordaria backusii]